MTVVINGDTGISPVTASGTSALVDGMTVGRGAGEVATNTAVGVSAGAANVSGAEVSVFGSTAGAANTASELTAFGSQAAKANTSGARNAAFGRAALYSNTTGASNTAIGNESLLSNTTASANTAVGYQAFYANTTGANGVAIGNGAGISNTTGNYNTFIGNGAGTSNTTGTQNTFIGINCGTAITTGSFNSIIGNYSGNQGGLDIRTASNYIVLSDGNGNPRARWDSIGYGTTRADGTGNYAWNVSCTSASGGYPFIAEYTASAPNDTTYRFITCRDTATPSTGKMYVYSNGNVVNANNSYGAISDAKLKENIVDSSSQWNDIKAIRVRKYSMKSDKLSAPNMLGVVAQELEEAGMKGLVFESPDTDKDNNPIGTVTKQVNYSILYMKAVKALQEAMERIEALEVKVTSLENK